MSARDAAVDLRAPFAWFGGKSRCTSLVWEALGDVPNYVEPFFGSGAVLLARPHPPRLETVNDIDCYLANFWRALQADPAGVTAACDWPVNETDLLARHQWLVDRASFRQAMAADPEHYDVRVAGWWVWGLSQWIGSGWCDAKKFREGPAPGRGVKRQIPYLSRGQGVHRKSYAEPGTLADYLSGLSARLRRVRVASGDWSRVCTPVVTHHHGLTGAFLDPPYAEGDASYAGARTSLSADVRAWAIEAGERPDMRIVLAGLEGEHEMPPSWRCVAWRGHGGYGRQAAANGNRYRERLWCSPACLQPGAPSHDLDTPLFPEPTR